MLEHLSWAILGGLDSLVQRAGSSTATLSFLMKIVPPEEAWALCAGALLLAILDGVGFSFRWVGDPTASL